MLSFGTEQNVELCWLKDFLFFFFVKLRLTLDEAENKLYRTQEGATRTDTERDRDEEFSMLRAVYQATHKVQETTKSNRPHNSAGDQTVPSATPKPETNAHRKQSEV